MTDYGLLTAQLRAFAEEEGNFVPLLSNASALLYSSLERLNWAGFYLVRDGELLLGPFQGRTACIRIARGKGVCGSAWERDRIELVEDVHAFAGHIACDSTSNSEIVVPIHGTAGQVVGVLDIDSPEVGRFTEEDRAGLADFVKELERWLRF